MCIRDSFTYDVGSDVYRKHEKGHDETVLAATAAHGLAFHAIVSFTLPAIIIKNAVTAAASATSGPRLAAYPRLVRFVPPGVGLACIPFMPLVDAPASALIDRCFDAVAPRWREGEAPKDKEHGGH